jgi:peptide/nickel transport system substrate-binding protein
MKNWKLLSCIVLVTLVVSACAQASPAASQTEAAAATSQPAVAEKDKYGGTFTWGFAGQIPGFNPILNDNGDEIRVYQMTSEPLFYGGENYPSVWTPKLATSYERSADGLIWTIHLRPNVLWQDGTPFTADDVIFWASAIQDDKTIGAHWMHDRLYVNDQPFKF